MIIINIMSMSRVIMLFSIRFIKHVSWSDFRKTLFNIFIISIRWNKIGGQIKFNR
jgi:hypothetical protein